MDQLVQKFEDHISNIPNIDLLHIDGRVSEVTGLIIEATAKNGTIGDICDIQMNPSQAVKAEIVGFKGEKIVLMPLGETVGVSPGSKVKLIPQPLTVPVGENLLGRVIDGLGRPIDGKGPIRTSQLQSVYNTPPNPLIRKRINAPLTTGIKSIDGLVTLGKGQRVGIFAGSGVGKSVLLGMISRYTDAEVNVIALIGERGREVREFIERDLGEEGLKRSVVIVATSDQAATVRIKGALIATSIAEYFRNKDKDVLLLMDSLTRVAMAQREIGLAIGEPPTTKGYTPSVFALLPRLLERAGNGKIGSITGLYTVLVEGDDLDEPISDAARSILDGHIVLSRKLATRGHYPAVDVLESVSRVKNDVIAPEQIQESQQVLQHLSVYRESEDLINIGAYVAGSNENLDKAIAMNDGIISYLKQDLNESSSFIETVSKLHEITGKNEHE